MQPSPIVGVVIPAHNESERLTESLGRIPASLDGLQRIDKIVVDDGSRDATAEIAHDLGCYVIRHPTNMGMGRAVRTGCDAAVRMGYDIVVNMDADGQHRAEDIRRLVAPLVSGEAQVVHGVRSFSGQMPPLYRIGNRVLNLVLRVFFGLKVEDSQCGFRAFRADVYHDIRWASADYGLASEIWVRLSGAGLRHVEIPIPTIYHDLRKGTQPMDGIRILRQVMLWRFRLPIVGAEVQSEVLAP
jgi:glycosyltransferase involved in cell wall biosynthesis